MSMPIANRCHIDKINDLVIGHVDMTLVGLLLWVFGQKINSILILEPLQTFLMWNADNYREIILGVGHISIPMGIKIGFHMIANYLEINKSFNE